MRGKLTFALTLLGLLLLFIGQNYAVVQVRFLFWQLEMSRAVLLLLVLVVGIAVGWTLLTLRRRATRPGTLNR